MCSARCGRSAPWSRRSARGAPSTCCPPPICRCGRARCRPCRRRCRRIQRGSVSPPGRRYAAGLFGKLAGELEQVEVDGVPGWTVAGDTSTPPRPHRGIRLLPYFDAYVVAGQPRERLYPGAAATRALTPAGQAGNYPVLLVDGVVGGVWHQRRSGRKLAITVEPLRELTPPQRRQLDDEVGRVGAVMEATATLT